MDREDVVTDARDELAELIRERCWPRWKYPETPESIADAILAAGWRAPVPKPDMS